MKKGVIVELKHSRFGISAFVVSVTASVLMFLTFVVAGTLEATTPGGLDENSAGAIFVGLFMIAFFALEVVAIGLGIAGLMQKDRKKVFSVLGIVFGSITILGTVFLIVLGNMM